MIATDEATYVESPIELDLLVGLRSVIATKVIRKATIDAVKEAAGDHRNNDTLIVAPQVWIGNYRVDFLVGMRHDFGPVVMRIVECDGYHYHRSNEQQKERDRKRDAALPFEVIRISGHAIFKDCFTAANEILEEITNGRLGRGTLKRKRDVFWATVDAERAEHEEADRSRRRFR